VYLSTATAVALTAANMCASAAILCLALASYAWWGNPDTILAPLWKVAVVLYVVSLLLRLGQRGFLHLLAKQRKITECDEKELDWDAFAVSTEIDDEVEDEGPVLLDKPMNLRRGPRSDA